jgi:two-component system chemotaxis response regulator CheY
MAINILIVDDSSLTRKKIKRIIEMTEMEVGEFLEAENGCQALEILAQSEVGLVLADLNMPEMNGAEMIHRIKSNEDTKSIPVVVISTESRTSRLKELLAFGIKDYLHKPFAPEDFQELISKLWDKTTEEVSDLVTMALSQALETTTFSMIMPIEDNMSTPNRTVCAKIGFTGTKKGTIEILAGMELCQILAQIFAGLTDTDEESACDVMQELANVTCGLFLPMVVSSTSDLFDITIPTAKVCNDSTQWDDFTSDDDSHILNVEGYMVATKLTINE